MALHRRKRIESPGWQDLTVLLLVGGVCAVALLWGRATVEAGWQQAPGRVVECRIRPTHYNAPDYSEKVDLTYQYTASGMTYLGTWSGFWPSVHSPNALPPEDLGVLQTEGYSLTVLFDPADPASSRLHDAGDERGPYGGLFLAAFCATLYYCVRLYPEWKAL